MIKLNPFEFFYIDKNTENKVCLQLANTIELHDKKLHLITGPSGCGKSTLLNLLNGLYPDDAIGYFKGTKPDFLCKKTDIACLFQNPFNHIIHRDASFELALASENKNLDKSEYFIRIKKICDDFRLFHLENRKTSELSHGEAQKLLLASLLASEPKVLLLDEPTAFLDSASKIFFYNLLNSLKKKMLIILVDHQLEQASEIADSQMEISKQGEISYNNIIIKSESKKSVQVVKQFEVLFKDSEEKKYSYGIMVENLSYKVSGRYLLRSINLKFNCGEVVILKGKNGSGKTTFLKLLAGLLKPNKGAITHRLDCKPVKNSNIIKHLGFVMQNSDDNFFFDTLAEEFKFNDEIKFSDLVIEAEHFKKSPFFLSEGQKKRAALLIQLNLNKKVIFYDEPTTGQDVVNINKLVNAILELKQNNILQIIISHDDAFIKSVATNVYEIINNEIISQELI